MVSLSPYEVECREIKRICDKYGHGNVMEWASALWRREARAQGFSEDGCFVPTCPSFIKKRFQNPKQHELYDTLLERVLGEKMEVKIVRLVDLDAVIDRLEVEVGYEGMREDLYSLPVVDAVPVVRCKDCDAWKRNVGIVDSPNGHCFEHDIDTNGQDFCSYGEKKGEKPE